MVENKVGKKLKSGLAQVGRVVTSVDLFAGAGGLSIGLHQAGVEVVCAVEYDAHAARTFAKRFPEAKVYSTDVRNVDLTPYRGKVDMVCGGPPCQPFSSGGLRNAADDARDMIPAFIEAVRTVQPRAFLMENVNGLTVGDRRVYLESVLENLRAIGYTLTWQVVNAADYGVPQIRKRLIVVGVREGVFEFPEPTHGPGLAQPYVASGEALATVTSATTNGAKVTYARNPDTRPNPYHGQLYNGGGRPLDLEQPAPTILASAGGNKTHFLDLHGLVPTYHAHLSRGGAPQTGELPGARRLTIEESAAIQTFPTDMVFTGPQSSQYRQIGNAVPPGLAQVIGAALVEHLAAHLPKATTPSPQQLQLFANVPATAMTKNKQDSAVFQAVTKVIETIDRFTEGEELSARSLPPATLRVAVDKLVTGKTSASVRVACLYLIFYKLIKPEYAFDMIPVGSRGTQGDKWLGAQLKDRHIVLGNVTSCFENIGSKGDQANFNLGTDARFKDFTLVVREASQEDIEKAATYFASLFAASQAVPPVLPALGDDILSFVRAKMLFKSLVEAESGGFIPQFLIAALLKVLRAKQSITVKTHNPNAADTYDGTAGDIEEFLDSTKTLVRAYEVTVRPDWKNRLPDFRAKMDKAGLTKYIIIASGVNSDEELREPAAMAIKLDPIKRDLAVVDIMDFLTVMAAELTATELCEAVNETYAYLVNPTLGDKHQHTTTYTTIVGMWLDTATQ